MLENANFQEDGWHTKRPENENPKDARCRLELQRICGTCLHYQGELRPARIGHTPADADSAACDYFKTITTRRRKA